MFITVRFGDDKRFIINPDCSNRVLLHHIKSKCSCKREDVIDLSDESGVVKNIHKFPADYGTGYFTDRETLILLKVEKVESDDERSLYIPMLTELEENKEFIEKLNPKPTENSSTKPTRTRPSGRGSVSGESDGEGKTPRGRRGSIQKKKLGKRAGTRLSFSGSLSKAT